MERSLEKNDSMAMMFAGIGTDYRKIIHKIPEKQRERIRQLSAILKDRYELDIDVYLNGNPLDTESNFYNWLTIYTCDYAIYEWYASHGVVPDYLIGYSMGLITALACSHAITFEDGAFLLYEINRKESRKEGMATIIGFEKDELVRIIKDSQCEDKVFIACENNPYCFGISGYENFIQQVCELAAERGALNIYAIDSKFAFHTPLYHRPERDLSVSTAKIQVVDSTIPVVSAIDQSILWKAQDLSEELIRNMYSTMKWGSLITALSQSGIRHFIEAGLGKGLTKISRSIEDTCRFDTFDTVSKDLASHVTIGV
ncbi:acyltransferase domain-containing protein [Clostridium boliviensis]|uniref:[acyl-carrier-protein] S-malonyltransferase n=1 Tax=Clostridium boliviensis TaxID=318465 RepID=A0ABU4GKA4_9CLOT|nr:acyltransferase domain-containing protein [Clostridium boliviensis]MDW2798050.1 acyltransferase domain-containing protein [Clostridium boliviensis]